VWSSQKALLCINGLEPNTSTVAERKLVDSINQLANWKVPLDSLDVRLLVKGYLDKLGINDRRFSNNFPGLDWLDGLTSRLADNVKRARAEVDMSSVNKYFDELAVTMADAAPGNVYVYDETSL